MSLCTSSTAPLTTLQKHLLAANPSPSADASRPVLLRATAPAFRNATATAEAEFASFEAQAGGLFSGVQRLHVSAPAQQQRQQWFGNVRQEEEEWRGWGGSGSGSGSSRWHEEFMMANASSSPSFAATTSWGGVGARGEDEEGGLVRMKMPMAMNQTPYFPPVLRAPASTLPPTAAAATEATSTTFDDAAFEAAFAAAAANLPPQPQPQPQEEGAKEETEQEEEEKPTDDIARTAANLLDSLKSDSSKKFRESEFLALMRRLRDGEVRVVGNSMVGVGI